MIILKSKSYKIVQLGKFHMGDYAKLSFAEVNDKRNSKKTFLIQKHEKNNFDPHNFNSNNRL